MRYQTAMAKHAASDEELKHKLYNLQSICGSFSDEKVENSVQLLKYIIYSGS